MAYQHFPSLQCNGKQLADLLTEWIEWDGGRQWRNFSETRGMHPAVECGMANREGWVGMDLISLKWKIMFMKCNPSENRGFLLGNGCKNVSRRKVSQTSVMSLM